MFKKTTLKNGLRVVLAPIPSSKSATVSFYVKAGSRHETLENHGIAHFLEHMAFKGSEKYKTSLEIAEIVEGFGGAMNAATGQEYIEYYIRAESSNLPTVIDMLNQLVFHPTLPIEEIEKEKGVIVEEINMYEDLPNYKVADLHDELLWPKHALGRNIAGTKHSVKSFTQDTFLAYHSSFFTLPNIVVCISGHFDEPEVLSLLEDTITFTKTDQPKALEPVGEGRGEHLKVHHKKSEQTHLRLGFRSISRSDPRRYAQTLLSMVMGSGFSSKLFKKIREELGLAYYIYSDTQLFADTGSFVISAGLNNEKVLQGVKGIMDVVTDVLTNGIEERDFERAKRHIKGLMAISLEDQERLNDYYGKQELLLEEISTYEDFVSKIDAVTVGESVELARFLFTQDNLYTAAVGEVATEALRETTKL